MSAAARAHALAVFQEKLQAQEPLSLYTADETLAVVVDVGKRMGKEVVVTQELSG